MSDADDGQLPIEVDQRFCALIPDYYAPQHLILAEGEGARCVIDLWNMWETVPGQTTLLYSDTCPHPYYTSRLRQLPVGSFRHMTTTLQLLLATRAILPSFDGAARIYVAAASRVERLIYDLLLRAGIEPDRIMVEVCDPGIAKVTCARCAVTMIAPLQMAIVCNGCGARLSATSFFSCSSISFLGLPVSESHAG